MGFLRKIIGLPNAALRGIAEHFVVRWLRDSGEGKHGEALKRAYWALAGRKTWVALLIGAIGFVLGELDLPTEAAGAWTVAGVLFAAGLADKAVRAPGRPAILADSMWYRALANNAGLIATLLTSAFAYVNGATCVALVVRSLSLSCAGQSQALLAVAAVLVYVGILDHGLLAKAPRSPALAAIAAGKDWPPVEGVPPKRPGWR